MKIVGEHVGRLLEARLERIYRTQRQRAGCGAGAIRPDGVAFSARSEEVRLGMAAARAGAKTDDPRLAGLAAEVNAGRFRPPAAAIADAILRDLRR